MRHRLSLEHSVQHPPDNDGPACPLLILLHGFMENEESMQRVAAYLHHGFRVVSVRAPLRFGEQAYGWARARFTSRGPEEEEEEFEASRQMLLHFLDEIQSTYVLDYDSVYIVGFSQGASLCLSLAVTEGERFAGVVALSGKLLEMYSNLPEAQNTREIPAMFVAHGTDDKVVPIDRARRDARRLHGLQPRLAYREYCMGHEIGEVALRDVAAWLYARLGP